MNYLRPKNKKVIQHQAMAQFAGIDLVKYIMAFAVVAIHFRPNFCVEWHYPKLLEWFIGLAVPYFFIVSGILVQRKLLVYSNTNDRKKYLESRIKKLIKLWIYWILISLPMALASYGLITGNGITNIVASVKSYVWMLAIGGWAPYAAQLWFVYSMIWVTLILRLSVRIINSRPFLLVLLIVFILISLAYWASKHFDIYGLKIFYTYTANILSGGVYILFGMLLARIDKVLRYSFAVSLLLISFILYYFDLPLNTEIGGIGLVIISLCLPVRESKTLSSFRSQSMWIYFTHEYVLFILFVVFSIRQTHLNPYLMMSIVFIIVATLAKILSILQEKPHFKYLKSLIN